jgi:hypothetical protein
MEPENPTRIVMVLDTVKNRELVDYGFRPADTQPLELVAPPRRR